MKRILWLFPMRIVSGSRIFGLKNEDAFKAATDFAGGIGFRGSVCGALTGGVTSGVTAIGLKYGRDIQAFLQHDPEKTRFKTFRLARKLWEKFEKTYGSCICHDIQRRSTENPTTYGTQNNTNNSRKTVVTAQTAVQQL